MSEIDTKAAREVLAKMTPGEWAKNWSTPQLQVSGRADTYDGEVFSDIVDCLPTEQTDDDGRLWMVPGDANSNAKAIAFLRNNAAAWLDAIDRLTRELAEVRRERDALLRFAKDVATQFDHDNDAHRYGTQCRACDAQKLLAAQQRPTDQ